MRPGRTAPRLAQQRGVAVITALLLTTLAITIVASLFWQQQVQVRSMENQRLQLQTRWILRGALDWARLILREDGRRPNMPDRLDEPWAVPLADTRLDEYVEKGSNGSDAGDAVLSGQIVDAQSRYNLANLVVKGAIVRREVLVLQRLLSSLRLKPELALATAEAMLQAQPKTPAGAGKDGVDPADSANKVAPAASADAATTATSSSTTPTKQLVAMTQLDDLLVVPGLTADMLATLKDYLVILPRPTPVNFNTASAEVLAARIDALPLAQAVTLVAARDRIAFKDTADFTTRLRQLLPDQTVALPDTELKDMTNFFIVYGKVRLDRASQEMQALIERQAQGNTQLIWIREN